MSHTHGHLTKAERTQLPAELQQRLAAWTTKASPDDTVFLTLARSPAVPPHGVRGSGRVASGTAATP